MRIDGNGEISPHKTWKRDELISLLGKPSREWTTLIKVEERDGAQEITPSEVDPNTDGGIRQMQWSCNISEYDGREARQVDSELNALRAQTAPDEVRVNALLGKASNILDIVSDICLAASRVQGGGEAKWTLIRVCSRHKNLGLVAESIRSI